MLLWSLLLLFAVSSAQSSGNCGLEPTDCYWEYDSTTKNLGIKGNGKMTNFQFDSHPGWYDHREQIQTVTIEGVTSIGNCSFYNCSSLKSVSISKSVQTIESYVFVLCDFLDKFEIPIDNQLISVSQDSFAGCSCILYLKGNGPLKNYIENDVSSNCWFTLLGEFRTVVIQDGITSIGDYNFYNVSYVQKIIIPSSVSSIGSNSFNYKSTSLDLIYTGLSEPVCETDLSILQIEIIVQNSYDSTKFCSKQVTKRFEGICGDDCEWKVDSTMTLLEINGTGNMSYYNSPPWNVFDFWIENVIMEGITSIHNNAFSGCSLKSIHIPETIISIGYGAFFGCTSLNSIKIPDSVIEIGESAFYNCFSLETIRISETLTSINPSTFKYCSSLKTITIPNSVTAIGSRAFAYCSSLKVVSISNSLTLIDEFAFRSCTSIEYIFVPEKVTSIKNGAFDGCTSLKYISIPESVTSIASYVFSSCTSLEYVKIPQKIKTIEDQTFLGCNSLKIVDLQESIESIGDYAFSGCTSLKSIIDGIHHFGRKSLSETAIETVVIGNGNEKNQSVYIGEYAFSNCKNLTKVTIKPRYRFDTEDTSIQSCSIQNSAFSGCSNIASVIIDGYVDEIRDYAFDFYGTNPVIFEYNSSSQPRNCLNIDQSNNDFNRIFSKNIKSIQVPKEYESSVFCPCDKQGCPKSYVNNNDYENIQKYSVLIEKNLDGESSSTNEISSESNENENNESSEDGSLKNTIVFVSILLLLMII